MMGEMDIKETALANSFNKQLKTPNGLRKALMTPMVCSILASLGIFGGISSLFVGIVSVAIHAVVSGDRIFDRVGTILLVIAIPMILIGSVFLDEIQGKK